MSSAIIEANSYVDTLIEPIITFGVNLNPEKHMCKFAPKLRSVALC
jgi:hypothetical protein